MSRKKVLKKRKKCLDKLQLMWYNRGNLKRYRGDEHD
nr:MAG TPA: hypothetical protein [Caudoviricetes sp.]